MWNLLNKGGNVTKERFTLNQLKYSNAMKALIDLYYSLTAGFDVYMKQPGKEIMNRVKKNLDIDISADLEYVAAPASQHGSVHRYEMKGDDWQTPDFINLLKVYLEGDDWQTPNIKNLLKVFLKTFSAIVIQEAKMKSFILSCPTLKKLKRICIA